MASSSESLPPPPPHVKHVPMARRGFGSKGQKLQLLTNHFKVSILYEDGHPVDAKRIGRIVLDKVYETYDSELDGKGFAYDGEKSLFTIGALPRNRLDFTVVLDGVTSNRNVGNGSPSESDRKRPRRQYKLKTYKVEISYASKIPMQAIVSALRGQESEHFQDAIMVLDIILRQHAAKQGCILVRQSFFHYESRNLTNLGGGAVGCRGFHSSFRATQGGLSLNIDVSTTMLVKEGPVVDFLIENQDVKDPYTIDWPKAKRILKSLRIKTSHSNIEYKITGLSDKRCKEQMFSLKRITGNGDGETQSIDLTVYEYFVNYHHIPLRYSGDFPCINVGKPKRPTFIPLELCMLVPKQRYTKASILQRAALVERSRQKPQERMKVLTDALRHSNYDADPLLVSTGISISNQLSQVEGRVLSSPKLKVGNGEHFYPRNGRWNFNNKKLAESTVIERWAVVNFSARCDIRGLCRDLIRCGGMKGIAISPPIETFEESSRDKRFPASVRVDRMVDFMKSKLSKEFDELKFILCLLPERKNSDLYGPWKRRNLAEFGKVTQCIAPPTRVNDQYLTNVLLKINAKLGGMNSLLAVEDSRCIPIVSKDPTIIIGMDVSHGSPGQSDVPSIAAVVGSREWPLISKYRACVRAQSPKVEMIDSLYKKVSDTDDHGIFRELLLEFYKSTKQRKPENIIIFRDGVSESQFNQVLNIELKQIFEACKFLDDTWCPRFTVVVAQKNHHTKFFQANSPDNVPPGTVIDNKICHPRNNDFYMCAHAGMIGTTRPTHYHVLYDELGFSADDLQELVHSLCYVYQRSTTAISIVAPIMYAHLAAAQVSQFVKLDEMSETSSTHTVAGTFQVPELPKLHKNVKSSMFFC